MSSKCQGIFVMFFHYNFSVSDCEEGAVSCVSCSSTLLGSHSRSGFSLPTISHVMDVIKSWLCLVDTGSSQMKSQDYSLKRAGCITALTTGSSIIAKTTTIHLMRITVPAVSILSAFHRWEVFMSRIHWVSLKYGAAQSSVEFWFSFVSVCLPGSCGHTVAQERALHVAVMGKDLNFKCCFYWMYFDLPLL